MTRPNNVQAMETLQQLTEDFSQRGQTMGEEEGLRALAKKVDQAAKWGDIVRVKELQKEERG